jgi:hypothetical protein
MQPHQYALAAGILWLVTLIALPVLLEKARHRGFMRGLDVGKQQLKADLKLQIRALEDELTETKVQNEAATRKHLTALARLQANNDELTNRIMSYTGMAVTRNDYERLLSTAEALRLAQRVHAGLKAGIQADRAAELAAAADELAKRVHAHLRATPAATAEAAA